MKEPQRWLDSSNAGLESRLLRTVVDEPMPHAALLRAGKRFGVSAALLSASSAALAQAAAAQTAASTATVVSAPLVATLGKAIAVGLTLGTLIVGAAHWTTPQRPPSSALSSRATTIARPNFAPATTTAIHTETSPLAVEPAAPSVDERVAATTPKRTLQPPPAGASGALDPSAPVKPSMGPAVARFSDEPATVADPPKPATGPLDPEAVPTPPPQPRSTLAHEVRALDSVRAALRSGDVRRALDELRQGERRGVFRMLSQEATVLRVEALGTLGRTQEAAALARHLVNQGVTPAQRQALERWLDSAK